MEMFRKLHNIIAVVCCGVVSMLFAASCSSDEPFSSDGNGNEIVVTIEVRGSRAAADDKDSLHTDLKVHEGIVLIYDENGVYEGGEKIDPDKMKTSLRLTEGDKRIIAVANPTKALRDLLAVDCHEPIVDEFGNVKTYKGDTVWRNIKPVHNLYADLLPTLSLSADYLKGVQNSSRMLLLYDNVVNVISEDGKTGYLEIPLSYPIARVDLHARCLSSEKTRVVDAAIRLSHISPWLNWNHTRPAVEGIVEAKFTDVSDRMTVVVKEDELFGDWVVGNVKENAPLATLYTYHTDTNASLEIGLRFKGGADYDWFPIDMAELLKESGFKGLEAGHLYQIFITVYPDKVGHIIVDPWIVPKELEFTIG